MDTAFLSDKTANFDPDVWGPHYWFFLHSVAYSYPSYPNAVTKRKYYDLMHNLPLFIPNEKVGNKFSQLLDLYPVSPYLDKKESFVRWVHFIHNKINVMLGKTEMTMTEAEDAYAAAYTPKTSAIMYGLTEDTNYAVYASSAVIFALGVSFYVAYRYHK